MGRLLRLEIDLAKKQSLTAAKKAKGDNEARSGSLQEARMLFSSACRIDPVDVEAWVKLSIVEKRLGNYVEAERCARRALAIKPGLGFGHHALGVALHSQRRMSEAIDAYRRAVGLLPDFADAVYLLGVALYESGEPIAALQAFQEAVRLLPNYADALGNIGAVLLDLGKPDEAIAYLERALVVQPNSVVARSNLANAERLLGRNDEAVANYRFAHTLNPESPEVMAGLADLLEKIGNLEEAQAMVAIGLEKCPDNPRLILVSAQLARRGKRFEDAVKLLEGLLKQDLPLQILADAEISLGQVLDQMGEAPKAFALIVSGKEKKSRCVLGTDAEKQWLSEHALAYRKYANQSLAESRVLGEQNDGFPVPVFLVGFPRSGTTLLEQLLDGHPSIQTMEEKGAVASMISAYFERFGDRLEALSELGDTDISWMRKVYFDEVQRHIDLQPNARFIDKLPLNIISLPFIWKVFPRARYILALRHPCDVVLSCLMQNFSANEGMKSFFTLEDTAKAYVEVMSSWRHYSTSLPLLHHRVRYEDLIDNIEAECRKLIEFLELPWDSNMLEYAAHAQDRGAINTPSYHQVVQPLYRDARYRWERYRDDLVAVIDELDPLISHFGYDANEPPK